MVFLPFSFGDFPRKNYCLIVVWLALLLAYLFVESFLTHKEENAIFIIIVFYRISQQNNLKNIMPLLEVLLIYDQNLVLGLCSTRRPTV